MGVGISACKGMVHPNTVDPSGEEGERSLSTVTRLPFLSAFEDRAPFKPSGTLSDKDESLLKALTHHRTPFAVVETDSPELSILYASGGCVAGLGMPAENIEGSSLAAVLKKGIQALPEDVERLEAAVRAKEVGDEKQIRTSFLYIFFLFCFVFCVDLPSLPNDRYACSICCIVRRARVREQRMFNLRKRFWRCVR